MVANAVVTHSACKRTSGEKAIRRSDYMTFLHQQIVDVSANVFRNVAALRSTGTPQPKTRRRTTTSYKHTVTDDWRGDGSTRKRRTRT